MSDEATESSLGTLVHYRAPGTYGNYDRREGILQLPAKELYHQSKGLYKVYHSIKLNGGTALSREAPEGWCFVDLPQGWYMLPCSEHWDTGGYKLPEQYAIVFDETDRARYRLTYRQGEEPLIRFAPRYSVQTKYRKHEGSIQVCGQAVDGVTVIYQTRYHYYDDDFGSGIGTASVRALARAWLERRISARRLRDWWRITAEDFDEQLRRPSF